MTEEHKTKIGITNKKIMLEKWKNLEYRDMMSRSHIGHKPSPEVIEKFRQRMIGNKNCLGRKISEEHKQAIREANTGKVVSLETRKKIGDAHRGEKCSFWKGGIAKEGDIVRSSLEYKLWRKSVFKRDDYTCQECNKRGGKLEVDHIKPFSRFPELRLELDNGRILCVPCHKLTPTYGGKMNKITYDD